MASTQDTKGFILVWNDALRPMLETCEYVFLNAKVLQTTYNKGYASYSPTGRKSSTKGKSIVWKKARLPLYSCGGQVTCRDVGFSKPEWPGAQGRRKLACLLSSPSSLVDTSGMVVESLLLMLRCGIRQRCCAGHGGTVPAMLASWEWWLFTNSPAQHGLGVNVVAFVLVSVSSGGTS
jgi:hypothetical protein